MCCFQSISASESNFSVFIKKIKKFIVVALTPTVSCCTIVIAIEVPAGDRKVGVIQNPFGFNVTNAAEGDFTSVVNIISASLSVVVIDYSIGWESKVCISFIVKDTATIALISLIVGIASNGEFYTFFKTEVLQLERPLQKLLLIVISAPLLTKAMDWLKAKFNPA